MIAVLDQARAVGKRKRLVEAENRPVSEGAERLGTSIAQQRQCAILDQPHTTPARQLRELPNGLRPPEIVDDVEDIGTIDVTKPLDLQNAHLAVRPDRKISD